MTDFISSVTPGSARNNFTTVCVGYLFTVGASNISVTDLGRWVISGNSGSHTITITNAGNTATIASASVNTSGATAGQFLYASITPVTLTAGVQYYIGSAETSGGDQWYDDNSTIGTTAVATINTSAYMLGSIGDGGPPTPNTSGVKAYVPVNFQYAGSAAALAAKARVLGQAVNRASRY